MTLLNALKHTFKFYNGKDINYPIKATGEITKFLSPFKHIDSGSNYDHLSNTDIFSCHSEGNTYRQTDRQTDRQMSPTIS